ncbi:MAG: hypothetical protein H8E66_32605 [Planctomycetes bacterium]|nr:hypothetical protein [Planctomycetota bacterium]
MFDLEQAITDWKSGFENVESMTGEHLQELEAHLRDNILNLTDSGLSEDEAFLVATKRLGHPVALEQEYAKVNGSLIWRKRVLWMLCGYVGVGACGAFLAGLGSVGAGVAALSGFSGTATGLLSIAVLSAGWAILLALIYRSATGRNGRQTSDHVSLKWCIGLVVVMIVGNSMGLLARLFHFKLVEPPALGESYVWIGPGGSLVHFAVVVACAAMMYLLSRPTRQSLVSAA